MNKVVPKMQEHWMKTYWRPLMALIYSAICVFDFIIFPLISLLKTGQTIQWISLTSGNGGMIHMAFGAILGIAAWTRGQENIITTKSSVTPS